MCVHFMTKKYKFLFVKFIAALFILNGCSNSTKFASENKDPFEKINRNVFQFNKYVDQKIICLLYTSPSPRDPKTSRMPSSA